MHKKLVTLAVLAAVGGGLAASAQAVDLSSGWFVNGSVGKSWYKESKVVSSKNKAANNASFGINLGWRLPVASAQGAIGAEVGYIYLGPLKEKKTISAKQTYGVNITDKVSQNYSGRGITLGLNGRFNPVDRKSVV